MREFRRGRRKLPPAERKASSVERPKRQSSATARVLKTKFRLVGLTATFQYCHASQVIDSRVRAARAGRIVVLFPCFLAILFCTFNPGVAAQARVVDDPWGRQSLLSSDDTGQRTLAASNLPKDSDKPRRAAAPVLFAEHEVLSFAVAGTLQTAEKRAAEASRAISRAFAAQSYEKVRAETNRESARIFVGEEPVFSLTIEDAEAAGIDSVEAYAALVVEKLQDAYQTEQRRLSFAQGLFSTSLVVFLGLLTSWLLVHLRRWQIQLQRALDDLPEEEPTIQVRGIELLSPAVARSSGSIALFLGRWFLSAVAVYAWLAWCFSLFDLTRGYTERLTSIVVRPVGDLITRLAQAFPLFVVALILAGFVLLLLRFIGLFLAAIPKQSRSFGGIRAELARPLSFLVRIAVAAISLAIGAPLVTGAPDGAFSRIGLLAVALLAVASLPFLSMAMTGALVLIRQGLKSGDCVVWRGKKYVVRELGIVSCRLCDVEERIWIIPTSFLLLGTIQRQGTAVALHLVLEIACDDLAQSHAHLRELARGASMRWIPESACTNATMAEICGTIVGVEEDDLTVWTIRIRDHFATHGIPLRQLKLERIG
jgi:hypothetical protein